MNMKDPKPAEIALLKDFFEWLEEIPEPSKNNPSDPEILERYGKRCKVTTGVGVKHKIARHAEELARATKGMSHLKFHRIRGGWERLIRNYRKLLDALAKFESENAEILQWHQENGVFKTQKKSLKVLKKSFQPEKTNFYLSEIKSKNLFRRWWETGNLSEVGRKFNVTPQVVNYHTRKWLLKEKGYLEERDGSPEEFRNSRILDGETWAFLEDRPVLEIEQEVLTGSLNDSNISFPPRIISWPTFALKYKEFKEAYKTVLSYDFWAKAIYLIFGFRCGFCRDFIIRSGEPEGGHLIPRRLGGSYTLWNGILVCSNCNKKMEQDIGGLEIARAIIIAVVEMRYPTIWDLCELILKKELSWEEKESELEKMIEEQEKEREHS